MTTAPPSRPRLVVVGNGMAGARAIEEILVRGGGDRFAITVFGEERHGAYNRILLSEVLASTTGEAGDELFLNPVDWYGDSGITLHTGVRIVRVDRATKLVHGDDGSVTPYDTLVLATGSRSFFPPVAGLWASRTRLTPGVFGFRGLDDVTDLLAHVKGTETAVVVGGGLLGLEAAAGLQAHGLAVHVVHPGEGLMDRQLAADASEVLRRTLASTGLHLHLGVTVEAVLTGADGAVDAVRLGDGSILDCDTVVVTAGVRPNTGLAAAAGLEIRRAVLVDDQLRSVDDEDVFVVGECAEHRGVVYGVVAPLWEQAAVLADVVTGADPQAAYHGSRLSTRLKVAGVEVAQMGLRGPERETDEVVHFSETGRGVHQTLVVRDDALVGATLVGDAGRAAALTQVLDSRAPLPTRRVQLLFDLGDAASGASTLPHEARVCHCHRVSKGDLVACVERGEDTVAGVVAATRAGTGCGSCRGLVAEVVDGARDGAQDGADA